jgi:hypothetical protein
VLELRIGLGIRRVARHPNWGADAATSGARFSHIVFFEPVVLFPGNAGARDVGDR